LLLGFGLWALGSGLWLGLVYGLWAGDLLEDVEESVEAKKMQVAAASAPAQIESMSAVTINPE